MQIGYLISDLLMFCLETNCSRTGSQTDTISPGDAAEGSVGVLGDYEVDLRAEPIRRSLNWIFVRHHQQVDQYF